MSDLHAYFDDSGTHDQSSTAVAACYIAAKTQWDEFDRNWANVLDEEGLEYFHTADFFEGKQRPYCEWDGPKKARVLRRLTAAINLRTRVGFSIAIPKVVYDTYAPVRYKQHYAKNHYTFAVKCCMGLIWRWRMRSKIEEPMQYIFDNVNKGPSHVRGQLMQIWKDISCDPESPTKYGLKEQEGSLFQSKKLFKPLQAADVLAWHMHDYMLNCVARGKDELYDARESFLDLRDRRPLDLGWFTGPQLVQYFEEMDALERKHGAELDLTFFKKRHWLNQDSETDGKMKSKMDSEFEDAGSESLQKSWAKRGAVR